MPSKCPPGVICIENVTIFFIILFLFIIIYLYCCIFDNKMKNKSSNINYNIDISKQQNESSFFNNLSGLFPRPSYSFSNIDNDILLNPYEPPIRDNRIFQMEYSTPPRRIPINIPTQSFDSNYRQIGILTRNGNKEMILPLMGRPLITNRDKWNFYTISENNNMVKLPITFKNRRCMSENGCDNIYNGDIVNVEGYNDSFKVTTYDNNVIRYLPYI